jgi:hypothetical protein
MNLVSVRAAITPALVAGLFMRIRIGDVLKIGSSRSVKRGRFLLRMGIAITKSTLRTWMCGDRISARSLRQASARQSFLNRI